EIAASVTIEPARPYGDSREAWIEFYNRSAEAVDLTGWGIRGGLRYDFEDGTILDSRDYLIVAADAEYLRSLYPDIDIVGDYERRLGHGGDLIVLDDPSGNPADTVRYYDNGRWPNYADGSGSSLELRDPDSDNSRAEAWEASDETGKSEWKTYTYTERATANIGPSNWREFVLGLLDSGEVLIDDISVIESPSGAARELISNGSFTTGTNGWRILGNHSDSEVIDDPEDPSNRVLRVVASGPTEHMHNQIQTNVASISNGLDYRVSFRARWLAGSNQVNTRLYFNRVPQTTLLDQPELHGTPGERNSSFQLNSGPVYGELSHAPLIPDSGEAVTVSCEVFDNDSVDEVEVWFSVNGGAWSSRPMAHVGGGTYRGTIPGQSSSRAVQFYIQATDDQGASSTFPREGRESRVLYRVQDNQARFGTVHNVRIVMTPADTTLLHRATNVMSNDRLGATVYWDDREVYYDVGVRLKGSERGRPTSNRVSFNVRFPRSKLFRGVHRTISIDRSGGWSGRGGRQDEIVLKHMGNKAGGIPMMYDDICRVIAPNPAHTGSALLMLAKYNSVFLDSAYEDGDEGTKFKFDLIYYPTTTDGSGFKLPQPDRVLGTDNRDLGDDKEVYRHNWIIRDHEDRDDYEGLIRFCKAMSQSGASLQAATEEAMDVNQWMRAFAYYGLGGVGDTYSFGNNHNNQYYVRPDGKVLIFPWDMDFCWARGTSSGLIGDQNIGRVIRLEPNLRRFYGHLEDIIDRAYNPTYMSRWTAHYGQLAGNNYSNVLSYISARRTYALGQLPAPVNFSISTNNGQDFSVDTETVVLEGNGGIDVQSIVVADLEADIEVEWLSLSRWRAEVPLRSGENELTLLGFDVAGDFSDSDSITVTTTFGFPPPVLTDTDPQFGPPGTLVTVNGSSLFRGIQVFVGGVEALVNFDPASPTQMEVRIPDVPEGAANIVARNSGSEESNALAFLVTEPPPRYVRADANLDGLVDVSDSIAILLHLFGGLALDCEDAADADDDGALTITDGVSVLNFLFRAGSQPSSPFPTAGEDPTDDALDCVAGL
ncbi:MAG: lamin tail domain-containing protein, partial [Planctomycetota bacterium]